MRQSKKPNISMAERYDLYRGEIEFEIRDRHGNVIRSHREPNLIKVFAKEMLAHRIAPTNVWDPAGSGSGAFVPSGVDVNDEYSAKYIIFGASFDENGVPLGPADTRFYTQDTVTGTYIPVPLTPGATDSGGLINPILISEDGRPLKKVESVYFEPSYQPSSSPLIDEDVRAMNNILVVETTLQTDEYNGLGLTDSDTFTITEVALCGGREIGTAGTCECSPRDLFLEGSLDGDAIAVTLNGNNTVTIDSADAASASIVTEGSQIKIVGQGDTIDSQQTLDQVSQYYLVTAKSTTGLEVTLDRTPVDSNEDVLTGSAGIFRDTLKIFSHRILSSAVSKSSSYEILVRWRVIFS